MIIAPCGSQPGIMLWGQRTILPGEISGWVCLCSMPRVWGRILPCSTHRAWRRVLPCSMRITGGWGGGEVWWWRVQFDQLQLFLSIDVSHTHTWDRCSWNHGYVVLWCTSIVTGGAWVNWPVTGTCPSPFIQFSHFPFLASSHHFSLIPWPGEGACEGSAVPWGGGGWARVHLWCIILTKTLSSWF
jgi:hypothetical protein